jgi:PKD repeat protein
MSSDNVLCSTNGYSDLSSSEIIPLGIKTDTAGLHIFTAILLNNFDKSTIIELEDRQEHTLVDLRINFYAVQFADNQIVNGRFFLHVSRAVTFSSLTAGCSNNDGELQLYQDNSIVWSAYSLFDSTGYLVQSATNISGDYRFLNLSEGNYNLVMAHGDNIIEKRVHINGNYIVAHIHPSSFTASVNQEITFYTTAHNTTDYRWSMGDITETEISGMANPTYAYLQAGVYNVVLTGSNSAGCAYRDSVTVTISSATGMANINSNSRNITSNASVITVVLNEEIKQGAELVIYNLLGQPVYTSPITELNTVVALSNQATDYYIVSVVNNYKVSTKRIALVK